MSANPISAHPMSAHPVSELVGIGSINVDLIVGSAAAAEVDLDDPRLGLRPGDIGGERAISAERSWAALDYLRQFDPVVSPGGSALNVVAGVAATGAAISVGYVGIRGTDEPDGVSLGDFLGRLGIDDELVDVVDGPTGLCLSITRASERTLLTTGGVNDQLSRFLTERRTDIVDHLAEARIIHLTSLAGLDDLTPVVDLLDDLRRRTDGVQLSCDPGAIWTGLDRPPMADEILARCHQILVNRREFEAIADLATDDQLIVVKGPERVDVHHRGATRTYPNPDVLGPDDIVDDTGSGDAFAAGFLIGQLLDRWDEADGVHLGMDLARIKLGFPGVTGIDRFGPAFLDQPAGPSGDAER